MPPFGSIQGRFGGRGVPKRVEFVSDSLGTGTTTSNQLLTIPAHFDGDLILAVCGSLDATPPTLPTGWTNAALASNTGTHVRMFYIISDGTLTTLDITTTTTIGLRGSGCMIFRNAVSVGATAVYTDTVIDALDRPFNTTALQNTDGTSVVVGATYDAIITGVANMTVGTIAGTSAIMARSNNVETFGTTNWTASTSAARISATAEIRGPILSQVWSALDTLDAAKTLENDNDIVSWGGPIAFQKTLDNPDMTTATLVSGQRYQLLSHFTNAIDSLGAGYDSRNAFNKINASTFDCWHSLSGLVASGFKWVSFQYPQAVPLQSYTITARTGDANVIWSPRIWTFQGSNDGSSWTTLDSQSGITFTEGQSRTYAVSSITAYQYFRLYVTNAAQLGTTGGGNYVAVGELILTQATAVNQPVYDPLTNLVTFTRTSSQFLNAGSRTLNIATNGGFTAVFAVRFTGTAARSEQIFNFGSGEGDNNVVVGRKGTTANISLYIINGTTPTPIDMSTTNNAIVQNQLAVFAVRYRAYDLSAMIFKNDVAVASGTASVAVTNRTVTASYIGRSAWAVDAYTNASVQGLYVYDRALANEEITNLSIHKFGANFGAVRGFSLQRLFTTYAGPVVRVRRSSDSLEQAFWADTLSGTLMPSVLTKRFTDLDSSSRVLVGSEVSSWGSPIAFIGTEGTRPDYISEDNVVRFSRANSDYLDAGPQTLAISTNGGFTAVCMVRFTGTAGNYERIFDFNNGASNRNNLVMFVRDATTNNIYFAINNGTTTVCNCSAANAIVQGELALFAVRYRKSDNSAQIFKNNELVASVTGLAAITDRTVTRSFIGRPFDTTAYFNGDIRGLYVYNYALTDSEIQSVILSKFGMPGITGSEYDAFVGAGTGYISQLFDQTGQGYHATQTTSTSQPWIVKNAGWTSQPTMRCGGVGFLAYNGATNSVVNTNYTVAVTTARTSSATNNWLLGGTASVTNQNLLIGYGNAFRFRVNHYTEPDYQGVVPTYTVPLAETYTVRHSSTFAKNMYRNGTFVTSVADTVALGAYAGAQIGRAFTPYYGDISSIVMFDSYLSNQRRQIVEADLAGLLGSPATYAPLDTISTSAKATCVAAYSLRQASVSYTGPIVRLRRPSDAAEQDFTAADFDSGGVATWAGLETPTVVTLMDQSGGGNHLTQATVANQPSIRVLERAIRFDTTLDKILERTWNVFGPSPVLNMHMVAATREVVRGTNDFLSFTQTGASAFRVHAPWETGAWYFDIGPASSASLGRAFGATSTVGSTSIFSGYKNPTNGLTGFRINGGTTYASTGSTSTMIATGVRLGGPSQVRNGPVSSHDFYEWLIFSARLPVPDEIALEVGLQKFVG